jgi:hypothetical protein
MLNLICFPHYTCGGLLCDILNDTWSRVGKRGDILSIHHGLGKIGDVNTVFTEFDPQELLNKVKNLTVSENTWIGTHCWPTTDLVKKFNQVIVVTTATSRSQIYRWARAYQHFFKPQWENLTGMERIDKMRETAKNYVIPFDPTQDTKVINLEFADVVENTPEFQRAIQTRDCNQHMDRWQEINSFLYDEDFWNSDAAKSFYQAEHEVKLGRYYIYD